jgi:hypothetical protein
VTLAAPAQSSCPGLRNGRDSWRHRNGSGPVSYRACGAAGALARRQAGPVARHGAPGLRRARSVRCQSAAAARRGAFRRIGAAPGADHAPGRRTSAARAGAWAAAGRSHWPRKASTMAARRGLQRRQVAGDALSSSLGCLRRLKHRTFVLCPTRQRTGSRVAAQNGGTARVLPGFSITQPDRRLST